MMVFVVVLMTTSMSTIMSMNIITSMAKDVLVDVTTMTMNTIMQMMYLQAGAKRHHTFLNEQRLNMR